MLDQAISRVRNDTSVNFQEYLAANSGLALKGTVEQSDEDLEKELLQSLQVTTPAAEAEAPLEDELVVAIHESSQAVHLAHTGFEAPANELPQANSLRMPSTSMAQLKAEEAYFVAPGDLLQHCINLKQVGEIIS